ncbi:protein MAIN-LIKE 1-like [Arachis duranensis]|uniref:Protein MAIN-LIKE 1-like n=1 Tax=Arachis duranensis TaxID=130453 RepID=A0A6P4DVN4_ARADU|nr:protein MAIN-LIKE 1-like [Arachis duranensis]
MTGLYDLVRLNNRRFRLDEPLVSAFVEWWRPETHTFYMPVAIQLGCGSRSCFQKFVVNCTWFQETFGECPAGADEETVRCFARAYIMMLLGTQLFADKSGNRIHIRWLPYVARLDEMGAYSWGSVALAWLYRWSSHNPSGSEKGPRVQMWRLMIDMLQSRDLARRPSGCASRGVGALSYGPMAVCDGTHIFCRCRVASD